MRSANVGKSEGYSVFNDSSTFYAAVAEFVQDEDYERFQDDIVFQSDGSIEVGYDKEYLCGSLLVCFYDRRLDID